MLSHAVLALFDVVVSMTAHRLPADPLALTNDLPHHFTK